MNWHEETLGYSDESSAVIDNGIDFAAFDYDGTARARLRAEWGLTAEHIAIGSIGRFDPQKDHAGVAEALARLGDNRVRWIVAGLECNEANGTLLSMLQRSSLTGTTRLLGLRSDMPELLSALDVLVIGSAFGEAMPMIGLEAVANCLPVVCTKVGDVDRLVIEPAFLAEPGNPQDLARAISTMLPLAEIGRPSLSARRKRADLMRHHSIDSTVAAYHKLYHELHDAGRGGPIFA
jgi:glycosyltransferase involved in cell wall biosynthesis